MNLGTFIKKICNKWGSFELPIRDKIEKNNWNQNISPKVRYPIKKEYNQLKYKYKKINKKRTNGTLIIENKPVSKQDKNDLGYY